jgi:hypothetical protein
MKALAQIHSILIQEIKLARHVRPKTVKFALLRMLKQIPLLYVKNVLWDLKLKMEFVKKYRL